jgi:RNA polymerase sigma-70 factor (ECF subfamily)
VVVEFLKKAPTFSPDPCYTSVEATVRTVPLSNEHVLIHQAQRGDRAAFAKLVEHYWDGLYRWLCHLSHDRHTAEDVAQEAFMNAMTAINSFRIGTNFRAWLFRIAHNAFANQARARRHVKQAFPENLVSGEQGPAELAMSKEAMLLLARAVGRLPTEFRAAFLLRAEEGMSFETIAEVLDITEETARWRVYKARQKLMTAIS